MAEGQRVLGGRYLLKDKVGTGGMATVFRAQDQVLDRTVAVKIMLPQYAGDATFAARFKQEAQAAAGLSSPYIVGVYDWGKDGDTYYIVMEYLRGTDLKSGIRSHGALDPKKVAQIGSQICGALSVAHKHEIIHRDIKPQNIMVQPDGNIKVMDFGIARAKNSHLTTDNSVLGTAHYVSPEQTQGKELGPTSDLYSLGIVMYEAATGRVPFDGDDAISVAIKQVKEQPIPPSQINPNVDPALEAIILKCMQKDPNDRFQTADELFHTLRDYLAGRLGAVSEATSVIGGTQTRNMGRNNAGRTQQIGRAVAPISAVPGGTTRFRQQSARAEAAEQEKKRSKHKRNVAIGIIVAILAVAIAAYAAVTYLGSQTAQTKDVPNLVGLTESEARSSIDKYDGFFTISVTYDYSDSVEEGKVIDQDPDAGRSASEGTTITVHVSKGSEPAATVEVPDLSNCTPKEASTKCSALGLVAQAGDSVYSSSVDVGHVASQDQAAGSTAKAGDTIVYHLSLGPQTITVPNVVGETEADAVEALESAGFTVVRTTSEYSSTVAAGSVIRQYPTSGSLEKGSSIQITLSLGPKPTTNDNTSSSSSSSNSSNSSNNNSSNNNSSSNNSSNSSSNSNNSGSNSSNSGTSSNNSHTSDSTHNSETDE